MMEFGVEGMLKEESGTGRRKINYTNKQTNPWRALKKELL